MELRLEILKFKIRTAEDSDEGQTQSNSYIPYVHFLRHPFLMEVCDPYFS
jgi:hypothetical protein